MKIDCLEDVLLNQDDAGKKTGGTIPGHVPLVSWTVKRQYACIRLLGVCTACCALSAAGLQAQDKFFLEAQGVSWNEAENWAPSGVPTFANNVFINGKTAHLQFFQNDAGEANMLTVGLDSPLNEPVS